MAQMKGVILNINPNARIVDATHDIEPFGVKEASLVLSGFFPHYPEGTTHVLVVDPGVGSDRRCIVVKLRGQFLVGPDNGVFSLLYKDRSLVIVREITIPSFYVSQPHPTFHGRDIFAPVAAHLSKVDCFDKIGPIIDDPQSLPLPEVQYPDYGIEGKIIYVDRFGNLCVNIRAEMLTRPVGEINMGPLSITKLSKAYREVQDYDPVAVINSFGFLEIAINKDSAFDRLGLGEGTKVKIIWKCDDEKK